MPNDDEQPTMKVRDAMVSEVLSLAPDVSLPEAAQTLANAHYSGAPVVRDDEVVGIISEADILTQLMDAARTSSLVILPTPLTEMGVTAEFIPTTDGRQAEDLGSVAKLTVIDAMTPQPISVTPESELTEAAQILIDRQFNRVPVIDNGKLVGILTRGDVLEKLVQR